MNKNTLLVNDKQTGPDSFAVKSRGVLNLEVAVMMREEVLARLESRLKQRVPVLEEQTSTDSLSVESRGVLNLDTAVITCGEVLAQLESILKQRIPMIEDQPSPDSRRGVLDLDAAVITCGEVLTRLESKLKQRVPVLEEQTSPDSLSVESREVIDLDAAVIMCGEVLAQLESILKQRIPVLEEQTSPDSLSVEGCEIFGLNVSAMTREEALALLESRLKQKIPVRLAFLNANLANVAYEDTRLRNMLNRFLLLNDGSGINLASKLLYRQAFPDNLNGTDFTPYFLDHCHTPLRIFLLGANADVASRCADVFAKRWLHHTIVGYQHGFFSKAEERQVIDRIRAAKPTLVLVAMGNGLQERWIERLVPEVTLSAWGVGALFDFLCSEVHRAPVWMRRLGIEWVYRLLREPGRMWRRYVLGNPKFIVRVLREVGLRVVG
ncbi:MAG: WecB/TagA/CpsF family glycosyltransferase [Methylobacter sp.]|uniref:WecB/TagA/CpsF family glycosyltransferase n=1 Tax=Methylobacter sp. TaxID=2051955 RepID=UPI00272F15DC|nr:WecB/TagA/CpsF family glycosyltransferase [Methylobacter sp.]MDP1664542.1 WecB/TagA/CpsF family glycosyltransferase [Methylobacter sp.]